MTSKTKRSYTKVHQIKSAADEHEKKLKLRGAKVKREKTSKGIKLSYRF